jgi:hypothetical protein
MLLLGTGLGIGLGLSESAPATNVTPAGMAGAGLLKAIYPPPVGEGMGLVRSGCPSLSGVNGSAVPRLGQLAKALHDLGGSRRQALAASDPAFWPMVPPAGGRRTSWGSVSELIPLLRITRANATGYKLLISHCGVKTVARSWIATICGPQECDPGLSSEAVFIDRLGHWLVVYIYP